ncbi:hypothetical protein BDC45DRAFT_499266 [Circinella umbellata]|nr:hypothetical protein BDC45DRAFT_499266 [Circinella umbellata]
MGRTRPRTRKGKQPSKEANVKNIPKNVVKNEKQSKKVLKQIRQKEKLEDLQATHERLNIQTNTNVVAFATAYRRLDRSGPIKYFSGYGFTSIAGDIPSIRGIEGGLSRSAYLYQLKSLVQLFKVCPENQSVTIITNGPVMFNFLNGLSEIRFKDEHLIKPVKEEISTIISQKNLSVNSKRHIRIDEKERYYLNKARSLAAEERDLYLSQRGLDRKSRPGQGKRGSIQSNLQNEDMYQLPVVQNQMQQPLMMNSNDNRNNNHVITTIPFHHQLPAPLQSAHLIKNNPNHGSSNNNDMVRSQREMYRFGIPRLSSQSQPNPRIVHRHQMIHTNQPPTIPLQLPPQQSLLSSYELVEMNVENDIKQVNRGGRRGLDSYHHKHQQGQQEQQQPHVRTTARGTVAGSSSIHSMMSPQIVTTTIPTPAVAYYDNNDNNGGGIGIGDSKVSDNTRLIGTGNHDNDHEGTEEVFVDSLENNKNQQESENGIIGTMKEWVSTTFRRFGNF